MELGHYLNLFFAILYCCGAAFFTPLLLKNKESLLCSSTPEMIGSIVFIGGALLIVSTIPYFTTGIVVLSSIVFLCYYLGTKFFEVNNK